MLDQPPLKNVDVVFIVVELLLKYFSSYSVLVPIERRFDITPFFISYFSEGLARFFALANQLAKLAFFGLPLIDRLLEIIWRWEFRCKLQLVEDYSKEKSRILILASEL